MFKGWPIGSLFTPAYSINIYRHIYKKKLVMWTARNLWRELKHFPQSPVSWDSNRDLHTHFVFCTFVAYSVFKWKNVLYERRSDLKGTDNHLVILDMNVSESYRVINICRSFNPANNEMQIQHFQRQLKLI